MVPQADNTDHAEPEEQDHRVQGVHQESAYDVVTVDRATVVVHLFRFRLPGHLKDAERDQDTSADPAQQVAVRVQQVELSGEEVAEGDQAGVADEDPGGEKAAGAESLVQAGLDEREEDRPDHQGEGQSEGDAAQQGFQHGRTINGTEAPGTLSRLRAGPLSSRVGTCSGRPSDRWTA